MVIFHDYVNVYQRVDAGGWMRMDVQWIHNLCKMDNNNHYPLVNVYLAIEHGRK